MHAPIDAHDTDDWLGVEAMLSVPGPWSTVPVAVEDAAAVADQLGWEPDAARRASGRGEPPAGGDGPRARG
jgi:hypothetical protein